MKVVAVRMPAKEMRFAAQVHEGDDRAERRGLGARMDASDAQVCRRFLNLQAPPTRLNEGELASTSSLNATTRRLFLALFAMHRAGADEGGTCVC